MSRLRLVVSGPKIAGACFLGEVEMSWMTGLMEQKLEYARQILEQRRIEASKTPDLNHAESFLMRQLRETLSRLERDRQTAVRQKRDKLDARISDTKKRMARLTESAKEAPKSAEMKLQKLEAWYERLRAPLPDPESLRSLEEQIRSTNDDIAAAAQEYKKLAEPFSKTAENFDLAGLMRMSGDALSHDKEFDGYNPFSGESATTAANALKGLANLGKAVKTALEVSLPAGQPTELNILTSFIGLTLYKLVTYSNILQDRREDHISEYLRGAATWDRVKLQSEIRKRKSESDAVPRIELPSVNLFTTDNFPLPDPLSRQRLFLQEIISNLEAPFAEDGKQKEHGKIYECNERIRKKENEKVTVQGDPKLTEQARRRLLNMLDDELEAEYDLLQTLRAQSRKS